ncbi:MAG: sugar phosphate isomerase/epimerase family protein [Chloroflexota bacterium]
MPKFGAHAFLWIDDWTVEKGNRAIVEAGRHGFDFIEIPMLRPDAFEVAPHKEALSAAGITATASLVLPEGAHMPAYPDKAVKFLTTALDKLEALGGHYLCGCLAYQLGYFTNEPPTAAERQTVAQAMATVAAEAQQRGITLGFEVCNRYETYLYNSLESGRQAIADIGADNIELHADTYHMNIEEEGYYQCLVDSADVLGYIHMSESHRGLVGSGTIDWHEIFRGLQDANYQGPLVLESFAAINPDLIAATKLWRPPNQSSEVLAGEGLRYLKIRAEEYGL